MLYMVTFTINIPQMLAYIPYMDPMGYINNFCWVPVGFINPTTNQDDQVISRKFTTRRWQKSPSL